MQNSSKPLGTQVIYLFAILVGVLAAFMFLYSMGDRKMTDSPKSIMSPAPVSSIDPPAATDKTVRAPAAKNLIETLTTMDPDARWEVSEHSDGRPSHILGGRIKCVDRDCNARSVAPILKTIAAALEIRGDDLQQTGISAVSNSFELDQYFKGYRVFNSSIKAYAVPNNTEIYHVLNDLRKIESVDTSRNISKSQARAIFSQHFSIEDESKILFVVDAPVVEGATPTDNRLVWWIQYGQRVPRPRSIEAFINANTGHVTVRSGH